MPNRYIREGINDSKTICSLSWQGEVFYRRLMLHVDDFGRAEADAEILRCELFKRQLAKVSDADIERLLAECESVKSLFTYQHGDKRFLVMNKWEQGRAKYSKHPPPPESVSRCLQALTFANTHEHKSPTPSPTFTPSPTPSPIKSFNGLRPKAVYRGKLKPGQLEVAARFEKALGEQWEKDLLKWCKRCRLEPKKSERVVAEVENAAKESRIKTTPAQYAEDTWEKFA